jgi:hypothetical protein
MWITGITRLTGQDSLIVFEIPWAGIGAFLMGAGSFLSGYAALKLARKKGKEEKRETPIDTDNSAS